MLIYLLLVLICTSAVFLVSLRLSEWLRDRREASADVASGLFVMVFLMGMVAVGVFVALGGGPAGEVHVASGLLVQSVIGSVLLPAGILMLKKKQDFS